MLCLDGEEDTEHLFFGCRIACAVWASQGLSEGTLSSVFWEKMPRRTRGKEKERGRRFAVIWAIWLHRLEVVFKGKTVSEDGVIHEVEKFMAIWFDYG